jgi:hypothetical protein
MTWFKELSTRPLFKPSRILEWSNDLKIGPFGAIYRASLGRQISLCGQGRQVRRDMKRSLCSFTISVGFGLRTSHLVNQVARAAGIRDLSAKVRGSRNAMNTVKLAVGMLQNRSRPVCTLHSLENDYPLTHLCSAFGDGFGHSGSRKDKIEGMRSATEVAFARGRRAALVSR